MNRLALGAAGLIVAALVACGGGDNGDGADRDLTKEDFAAEVEQICTDIANASKLVTGNVRREDIAAGFDKLIPVLRSSVGQLNQLELPDGEAGDLAKALVDTWETDIADKLLPALEDVRAAFDANDRQAFREAVHRFRDLEVTDTDAVERELDILNC
jgi:hypothetical protein